MKALQTKFDVIVEGNTGFTRSRVTVRKHRKREVIAPKQQSGYNEIKLVVL